MDTETDVVSKVTWKDPLDDTALSATASKTYQGKRQCINPCPNLPQVHTVDTFRMQAWTLNHSVSIPPQERTHARIPPKIVEYIEDTHINWVSLQPGVANFARSLIARMGAEFEVTIVEEDTRLATLSQVLCRDSTIVCASSTSFLKMLSTPSTSRSPSNYILSHSVNNDVMCLPLVAPLFPSMALMLLYIVMWYYHYVNHSHLS